MEVVYGINFCIDSFSKGSHLKKKKTIKNMGKDCLKPHFKRLLSPIKTFSK